MISHTTRAQDHIRLIRECVTSGERASLRRHQRRGALVTVARGAYLDAGLWNSMDHDARYRLRIHAAAAALRSDTVFAHESAVALWRLPWVDVWPDLVHTAGAPCNGGRSNTAIFRHSTGIPDNPVTIDGLRVAPMARTVVDVARTVPFRTAVVVADAALRRTAHPIEATPKTFLTRSELMEELALVPLRRGAAKARAVIEFADGRADRPGESLSRVGIHRSQLTAPELQVSLRGKSGRAWIVDFWWPRYALIGEFDGRWKYTEPEFLRGRTPHQVLLDEKFREDDLRAAGYRFSRWDWEIALSRNRLRAHLLAAGLR